jgi:hypothetical protein
VRRGVSLGQVPDPQGHQAPHRLRACCPSVLVTNGKTHDRRAVQDLNFKPDDLLIFDRAYLDYGWLYQLHQDDIWFVTRLKRNSCYEVIQEQQAAGPVLADQLSA